MDTYIYSILAARIVFCHKNSYVKIVFDLSSDKGEAKLTAKADAKFVDPIPSPRRRGGSPKRRKSIKLTKLAQVEQTKSDTMGLAKTLLQNVKEMRKGIEHDRIQAKIKEANERPKNIKTQPKIRLDKKVKQAIAESQKVDKSSTKKTSLQNGGQRIPREKGDDGLKAPKKSSNKVLPMKKESKSMKKSSSKNLISYEKFVENMPEPKIVITNPTSPDLEAMDNQEIQSGNPGIQSGNPDIEPGNPGIPSGNSGIQSFIPGIQSGIPGIQSGNPTNGISGTPEIPPGATLKKSPSKARIAKSQSQSKFNSMPNRNGNSGEAGAPSPTRRSVKASHSESNLPQIKDWPERKQGTIIYPKDINDDAVPFTYSPPGITF